MIALNDGAAPIAEAPASRPRRAPRRLSDPTPKNPPIRLAKSRDAGMTKVCLYLPVGVAEKLAVGAILRRVDQSDLASEILGKALGSVTFYDRSAPRVTGESLTVTEIGPDPAA